MGRKIRISHDMWLGIGKVAGWIAEDSGKYKKLDTQLFPECVGTDEDRDVVGKHTRRKKQKHKKKKKAKSTSGDS